MSMIEKVAEALRGVYSMYPDEDDWKRSAIAAIEAMREPDDLMTSVGWWCRASSDGEGGCWNTPETAKEVYQQMLNAALKETENA